MGSVSEGAHDELYRNNSYGYWLASPSAINDNNIMMTMDRGGIRQNYLKTSGASFNTKNYGIRPVVSLKSNVKLVKDGTNYDYTLSEV